MGRGGVVFAWLLLVFRSLRRAGLALVPVLTAVAVSALLVELLGLQVSALGALSSPLVVAICTEFSVLIVERYLEERRAGRSPDEAVATASLRIGRAFSASGLIVAGGFAVLAVSGLPLLTSFGIIVALNVMVSLVVALALLPPLLTWGERRAEDGVGRGRTLTRATADRRSDATVSGVSGRRFVGGGR